MLIKKKILFFFNILVIILFFLLPYYIFDGKLFLGGDDTRLLYSYPREFIVNNTFFSWHNISSVGIMSTDQFILPLISIWAFLSYFISSKVVLLNLAFSLPFILGFVFFQKLVKELFEFKEKDSLGVLLGALFYVMSPILIINQMFIFLTAIWFIGSIPLGVYLFIRYLKTSKFKYVYLASICFIIFSNLLYSIPWLAGFLLPLFIGLITISPFFRKQQIIFFLKRFIIFFSFIAITQSYWLIGFVSSYFITDANSFAQKFVSKGFIDTFTPTVMSTATGNILYPILGLFHRQITVDFNWHLSNVFSNYYDHIIVFNLIFIFVILIGIIMRKKVLDKKQNITYLFIFISFIYSLFLFTVNIGPLKDVFLFFGNIPGFLMFRNFYDKFAVGYVIIYSILITISLVIVRRSMSKFYIIYILFGIVVLINFMPVKAIVNSPMWNTKNVYRALNLPNEYLYFMEKIKQNVRPTNLILNLPFGTSTYSVIREDDSNNVFVGVSPVRIFSGISDISGHYSLNYSEEANLIDQIILSKDYEKLNNILKKYNINYVMVTKNIPEEVKRSWVFDKKMLEAQDQDFIKGITSKKILTSSKGNYELYLKKEKNNLLRAKGLTFKRISPVKYKLYIKGLNKKQELLFRDSFHGGWKLYLNKSPNKKWCNKPEINNNVYECKHDSLLFEKEDIKFLWEKFIFSETHNIKDNFLNSWFIDKDQVVNKYTNEYFVENNDGTIDIELTLYFKPQTYFYAGTFLSILFLIIGGVYLLKYEKK